MSTLFAAGRGDNVDDENYGPGLNRTGMVPKIVFNKCYCTTILTVV